MVDRVRVLYIGGLGRSGSTVLSRALGELPGFFHVGELVFLWSRGATRNELCGCGSRFLDCPFWTDVGKRAFGGWEAADPSRVAALQHEVDRTRYLPQLLRPGLSRDFRRRLGELTALLGRLYAAIQEVSGCSVVVDSSKHVSYAATLRQVPSVDLRLLHVIRDSRGVAHSWAKKVKRPDVVEGESYMAKIPVPKLAARWTAFNGLFDVLRLVHGDAMGLRYERFVAEPAATLTRIAALAGREIRPADLDFVQDAGLRLSAEHSVSGNPMRFTSGPVPLRVDDAWRSAMAPGDRAVVTALTTPGMLRYGYRLRGKTTR
ncbi:sulfotransferase [Streptomyces sp. NBC_01803]|uniref:sulfotransferase n=1 Tax=Streptomyces sp. NBC_01803 TaxID=2975946 RepID=UPI002DD7F087|nr:sulfotransferase [Streptomyces sp. NBC_01803]WSA46805.1 sulfotransferase [Streptomyces sp. NBC_01803]